MGKEIRILDSMDQCTGCGACCNICPQNAIKMQEGYHTFLYPHIDVEKCIECQQCINVCPINNYKNTNSFTPIVYAAQAEDVIRSESSSGGVFTVVCDFILGQNGCIFGTAWSEGFQAKFIKAENWEDALRCRGSKYVQSDVGLAYREAKMELEKGTMVAFVGCPCQIAGLKNYLKIEYDNLILIDILCHGVPSQKLFDMYLEGHEKERIKEISFRDKKMGWRCDVISIAYYDKETYVRSWKTNDEYEVAFQEKLMLRDSCEDCIFSAFPRVGDISIGDFWGINQFIEQDGKGTSLVFVNNDKGAKLIEAVSSKLNFLEKIEVSFSAIRNRINSYYPHHQYKALFFDLLQNHTFTEAVNMAKAGKYDIAIIGIPTVDNFGGTLTYVGLYYALKELNYVCCLIERPKDCKHPPLSIDKIYNKSPFEEGVLINNIQNRDGLKRMNDKADIFLVGSDQLFHDTLMTHFSEFALLDWVSDNKKKVAYAASFGHDKFTGNEYRRARMAHYLKKFDAFSVRETSGVELAKKEFGVDSVQVLDPVFLCSPGIYEKIAENTKIRYEEDYIAAYILDPSPEKAKILTDISEILRMPIKVYTEMFYSKESVKDKWNQEIEIGKIEERLSCILNSKYMITDSFHGVCFSIIFRKNFIAINNKNRGSARFESLLSQLNLTDRLINVNENILNSRLLFIDIDYIKVYELLSKEIERSRNWLKNQLKTTNPKSFSDEDVIIKQLEQENGRLCHQLNRLKNILRLSYIDETDIYNYIGKINQEKEHLLIIITAKDTPGLSISDALFQKFHTLGIKADLKNAHWCGYIAVIYCGVVVYEECKYQKKLEYQDVIHHLDIKAVSAPLHCGNDSEMIINGVPYSAKSRGMNFLIYDFDYSYVTDSVGFDTHDRRWGATRKA